MGTLALEACQLHPRLNTDLLIAAALVHDIGKTREFDYGAEIAVTDEGRLLGHVELGLRCCATALRARALDNGRFSRSRTVCSAITAPRAPGRRFGSAEAIALYRLNAVDAAVKGALEHGLPAR